jgi:hypothetical protein
MIHEGFSHISGGGRGSLYFYIYFSCLKEIKQCEKGFSYCGFYCVLLSDEDMCVLVEVPVCLLKNIFGL